MRVLFVYCNSMQENALPVGISQLIACTQQAGINVGLFDTTFYRWDKKSSMEIRMENLQFQPCSVLYNENNVYDDFRNKIEEFSPDLIGFSLVEPTFHFGMKLLDSVKDLIEKKAIKVAVGGVHAIYAPQTFIDNPLIDFICIGEGEESFVELCNKMEKGLDLSDTRGFFIKNKKDFNRNPLLAPVNINSLPILDFTLFGERFLQKPMMGRLYRTISLELTRGCPYQCTYCGNAYLTKMFSAHGRWYRLKSIEKIQNEYKEYIKKYNPEFIYKHSESFLAVDKKRLNSYMEMYSEFNVPYWIETRPEDVTEEKAEMLARTNCKRISIGLESGNELYRKKVLKRNYTNDQVKNACAILRDKGISFSLNLIIGFPDETRDMIFDGVKLLRDVKPDSISIFLFTPYRGCELRKVCEQRGLIDRDFIGGDYFQMEYCLKNNTIGAKELLGLFRTIPLYVQMATKDFNRIKIAEQTDDAVGNKAFIELRDEYYKIKKWVKAK